MVLHAFPCGFYNGFKRSRKNIDPFSALFQSLLTLLLLLFCKPLTWGLCFQSWAPFLNIFNCYPNIVAVRSFLNCSKPPTILIPPLCLSASYQLTKPDTLATSAVNNQGPNPLLACHDLSLLPLFTHSYIHLSVPLKLQCKWDPSTTFRQTLYREPRRFQHNCISYFLSRKNTQSQAFVPHIPHMLNQNHW